MYNTYEDVKPLLVPFLKRERRMKLAKDVTRDVKDVCAIMDMFLNEKHMDGKYTDFHADTSDGSLVLSMDMIYGFIAEHYNDSASNFASLLRICDHATIKSMDEEIVRLTVTIDIA